MVPIKTFKDFMPKELMIQIETFKKIYLKNWFIDGGKVSVSLL